MPKALAPKGPFTKSKKTEADLVKLRKEYGNKYYQLQNSARRGQISIGPNGEGMITLFKSADKSTFLHEMGHMMLEWIFEDGTSETVNEETRHDYEVAAKYLGITDMDVTKRNQFAPEEQERLRQAHEKFARSIVCPAFLSGAFRQFSCRTVLFPAQTHHDGFIAVYLDNALQVFERNPDRRGVVVGMHAQAIFKAQVIVKNHCDGAVFVVQYAQRRH